jgi:hypothetical protein
MKLSEGGCGLASKGTVHQRALHIIFSSLVVGQHHPLFKTEKFALQMFA